MADCDDDWYNKDEDELVQELKLKSKEITNNTKESTIEYINSKEDRDDEYLLQHSLNASKSGASTSNAKISTADLRKIAQTKEHTLEVFLFAATSDMSLQIAINDSQERVLLFLHIQRIICDLKLPGFGEILHDFVSNADLLEHLKIICTKLFNKKYKAVWSDEKRIDEVIDDIHIILLQAHQAGIHTPKLHALMRDIQKLILSSDAPYVVERSTSRQLGNCLEHILETANKIEEIADIQIYPTLDELNEDVSSETETKTATVQSACDIEMSKLSLQEHDATGAIERYIKVLKKNMREDFMISLRSCVHSLKTQQSLPETLSKSITLHTNVCIVVNEQFLNAQRHEMVFVDILGSERASYDRTHKKKIKTMLQEYKTGALLCFTTNYSFEDLILASVTYTDVELMYEGYIGIEIARQYNIGNIYNKKLIMFETPAFFEPYRNVYNFLNASIIENFAMKEYIVFGETNVKAPAYLQQNTTYKSSGKTFMPLQEAPPRTLPLNKSQLLAFGGALKQEFALIQGPPGTGKTHLSVQLMKTLIDNSNCKPIILITYTNDSLDKFLLKLSTYTDRILRFGKQTRIPEIAKYNVRRYNEVDSSKNYNPRLKRLYYVTKMQYKAEFEYLQEMYKEFDGTDEGYQLILTAQHKLRIIAEKLDNIRIMFQYYAVCDADVIAMTTTCAARINFLFRLLKSSIVIFEEAAEIQEAHIIACLTAYTKHVIMIGDHLQLQPYTASYHHSRLNKMNVSLFERLINSNFKCFTLNTQYRMRPSIAALICPIIYEHLGNDEVVENYPIVYKMQKNLYFLTHDKLERKNGHESSISNSFENKKLYALAKHLISSAKYTSSDIVILSPYIKQVQYIKSKLATDTDLCDIKVATVDSFQGLEANIVLLSLVRSNKNGQIGFLNEKNRICVALSRAKHGMYIVGNMQLLAECCDTWNAIKQQLLKQDALGDKDFPYKLSD